MVLNADEQRVYIKKDIKLYGIKHQGGCSGFEAQSHARRALKLPNYLNRIKPLHKITI